MAWLRSHLSALLVVTLLFGVSRAEAEPLLVSIEGTGAAPLTTPQSQLFGLGATGAIAALYPLAPAVLLGVRLRGGLLRDGPAPSDTHLVDPGAGSFEIGSLVLRLRPFAAAQGARRAVGLFVDVGGGGAITGKLQRPAIEAGVGYGIRLGALSLAPTLRYLQVLQSAQTLPNASADARLLLFGLELTFFDARPVAAEKAAARAEEPSDRDGDGIPDASDKCPDDPEDFDNFQDKDGCPDPDNDKDGIPDVKDKCPDKPEDFDNFEDKDGCPDPDNDQDGFLDADDQCPNEAEIVNGNKDFDGCPDEGLIEFKDDRIVLEERVLFDFERARVKHEARPVLRAITNLKSQHPEWIHVRIEGHADARGDAKFNQELSEQRAKNVMKQLINLGIPAEQIEFVGYGATRLRDKRNDEQSNARNRRVEFVVIAHGDLPNATPPPSAAEPSAPSAPSSEDAESEDAEGDHDLPPPPSAAAKPALPAAPPAVKPSAAAPSVPIFVPGSKPRATSLPLPPPPPALAPAPKSSAAAPSAKARSGLAPAPTTPSDAKPAGDKGKPAEGKESKP